jgi:hypothetical protein
MKNLHIILLSIGLLLNYSSLAAKQKPKLIADHQNKVTDISVFKNQVYWIADGRLYLAIKNDAPIKLGTMDDGVRVATDGKNAYVMTQSYEILRINKDDQQELLAKWKGKGNYSGMFGQIVYYDEYVYWSSWDENEGGTIRRVHQKGGSVELLFKHENIKFLALDITKQGVFFSDLNSLYWIKSVKDKDEQIYYTENGLSDMAVDGNFIYFIEGAQIYKFNFRTKKKKRLLGNFFKDDLISLDISKKYVIFSFLGRKIPEGRVYRVPKKGGTPKMLTNEISNSQKIVVVGKYAYLYTGYCNENDKIIRLTLGK